MPDLLGTDLAAGPDRRDLLLIAVELVATSGAMTATRHQQIARWLQDRGHGHSHLVTGTVFRHRHHDAARRLAPDVAWGSFVWYAAEPEFISLRVLRPRDAILADIVTTPEALLQ